MVEQQKLFKQLNHLRSITLSLLNRNDLKQQILSTILEHNKSQSLVPMDFFFGKVNKHRVSTSTHKNNLATTALSFWLNRFRILKTSNILKVAVLFLDNFLRTSIKLTILKMKLSMGTKRTINLQKLACFLRTRDNLDLCLTQTAR